MISAYAASKAAVVRFIETLAEEEREHRIDVNAIAPGALNTRMLDEILEAGPAKVGAAFYERALKQREPAARRSRRGPSWPCSSALAERRHYRQADLALSGIPGPTFPGTWAN